MRNGGAPARFSLAPADAPRAPLPIDGYGLIGDCHGCALVGYDGGIDWCCFARFDAAPLFSRILDDEKGGCVELRPTGRCTAERRYLPDTNLLETTFVGDGGRVRVTDFMPLTRETGETNFTDIGMPGWVVRIVEGVEGRLEMLARYRPNGEGFAVRGHLDVVDGLVTAPRTPTLHVPVSFAANDGSAEARFPVAAGQRLALVLAPDDWDRPVDLALADRLRDGTADFWRDWVRHGSYSGPYKPQVIRSALALKAMTYAPTGAMVAAPTTSLPEEIGGTRNWDYRFCWLRDTALTLLSLVKFGHWGEALRFERFLVEVCHRDLPRLAPVYALDGGPVPQERTIGEMAGYRGSRPVRVGNLAGLQHQKDVYGQVQDLIHLYRGCGGRLDAKTRDVAIRIADHVAATWTEPDAGIWEPRIAPRRHVHSALYSWVALDRAIDMFGPREDWVRERAAILADIRSNGVHPTRRHLLQVFGGEETDAALLVAPSLGIPLGEDMLAATVAEVRRTLSNGPLVHRYRTADGLPGGEGAFLTCSFWLVDALVFLGRREEARAQLESMLALSNDLGLYGEQMDPGGVMLANFPQAFTHLALVHSAVLLDLCERCGQEALDRRTHADRARLDAA